MATTDVLLIDNGGVYVPSVPGVTVNAGDTVSFSTDDGSAAILFFSPAAAAVVSPSPGSAAQIPAGGSASFTFTSSDPGAYSVYAAASGSSAPTTFPSEVSQSLFVLIDNSGGPSFGGPHLIINPGS
jgi:hypothetical protein